MEDLKLISATEAVEDFCFYINSEKLMSAVKAVMRLILRKI